MLYNIDITDLGEGKFKATYRDSPVEVTSSDPEHEICYRMNQLGFKNGPVQFWRDGIRALSHSSLRKMAHEWAKATKRVRLYNFNPEPRVATVDGQTASRAIQVPRIANGRP